MKYFKLILVAIVFALLSASCGVDGDPGFCYISIDWEYYSEDYGVYYYEDNNPDVPKYGESNEGFGRNNSYYAVNKSDIINSEEIVAGQFYESYPGRFNFIYESQDSSKWYQHFGYYELRQNPGTTAGFLHDGLDGADTYIELYLYIYARKGVGTTQEIQAPGDDLSTTTKLSNGATALSADTNADNAVALRSRSGRLITGDPLRIENNIWEKQQGDWVLRVEEQVKVYEK